MKKQMKQIYLLLFSMVLIGCNTHKQITSNTDYTDTSKSEITDSVHSSNDIAYTQDINDSIVTVITERITEVVRDTNNVVTERLIERVINTHRGNSISTQLNVITDSVRVSGEDINRVTDFKDNSSIAVDKDSEVGNIVFWIFLTIVIVVVVLGIYWGYKLL